MADSQAIELISLGDKLFSRKMQLNTLWQSIAEECYPEKSDFNRTRLEGEDFADRLFTSFPAQMRRDLAYAYGALTRPKSQQWFDIILQQDGEKVQDISQEAKDWLAWARDRQRGALYSWRSLFQKTMQESDNDFVTFGNAVVMMAEDHERTGRMVFLPRHLRDCAWAHDCYQVVNVFHSKFKIALRDVVASPKYGGMSALSEAQKRTYEKDPYCEVEFRHCVMPNADYDAYMPRAKKQPKFPHASIYINLDAQTVVKEGGYYEFPYHVRRWFLNNNSAYAYSPAAMLGLIEARLLQSQERVIMDAGERVVDPPSIATRDAVLGQVANYAGATTWIDSEYIEHADKALQYLDTRANIPIGMEMKQDTREILKAAWFINKLNLPNEGDMTAFEVNERLGEYIRTVGPAVEPAEVDNAALLDPNFAFNLRLGRFGPVESIPREVQGADTAYEFDGPVQAAMRRQKLQKAKEIRNFAFEEIAVRPEASDNYDFDKIDRDASEYMGAEPGWLRPEDAVAQLRQQRAQAMQQQQQMQQAAQTGEMLKGAIETVPAANEAVKQIPQIAQGLEQMGAGQ